MIYITHIEKFLDKLFESKMYKYLVLVMEFINKINQLATLWMKRRIVFL